ncbi:hypothetical protein RR46_08633 [Papilio xuthus]|uniref:Uncharacterized protein n=1 Tax=Papilio xuthus TaxID=66420 RepID=A0A194QDR4_PAPXU|nr:hypothetical protein RR46_08633 [Papilio xuthus]
MYHLTRSVSDRVSCDLVGPSLGKANAFVTSFRSNFEAAPEPCGEFFRMLKNEPAKDDIKDKEEEKKKRKERKRKEKLKLIEKFFEDLYSFHNIVENKLMKLVASEIRKENHVPLSSSGSL